MKTQKKLLNIQEIDGFTIETFAEKEYMPVEAYLGWHTMQDREDILAQINASGTTGWFCATINVYKTGILLSYSKINCCSYPSREKFLNDPMFTNILTETLSDAKQQLPLLIERLRA